MKELLDQQLEEFDKKFPFIPHNDNFGADGSVTGGSDISEEVKSFIVKCHQQTLEKVKEMIEGKNKEVSLEGSQSFNMGYNLALYEILSELNKEIK